MTHLFSISLHWRPCPSPCPHRRRTMGLHIPLPLARRFLSILFGTSRNYRKSNSKLKKSTEQKVDSLCTDKLYGHLFVHFTKTIYSVYSNFTKNCWNNISRKIHKKKDFLWRKKKIVQFSTGNFDWNWQIQKTTPQLLLTTCFIWYFHWHCLSVCFDGYACWLIVFSQNILLSNNWFIRNDFDCSHAVAVALMRGESDTEWVIICCLHFHTHFNSKNITAQSLRADDDDDDEFVLVVDLVKTVGWFGEVVDVSDDIRGGIWGGRGLFSFSRGLLWIGFKGVIHKSRASSLKIKTIYSTWIHQYPISNDFDNNTPLFLLHARTHLDLFFIKIIDVLFLATFVVNLWRWKFPKMVSSSRVLFQSPIERDVDSENSLWKWRLTRR